MSSVWRNIMGFLTIVVAMSLNLLPMYCQKLMITILSFFKVLPCTRSV